MSPWFRTNQAIGLYLVVLTGALFAYIWFSPWSSRVMRDGFQLGFFPLLGAGTMLLCAAVMLADPLRDEIPDPLRQGRISDAVLPVVMLMGIAAYFALMRGLGFLLVTPVFLLAYMLWLGLRPFRLAVVLALLVPVGTYVLFTLLGVRLPNGILPRFL